MKRYLGPWDSKYKATEKTVVKVIECKSYLVTFSLDTDFNFIHFPKF